MSGKLKMKRKAVQSSHNTKRNKCNTETQYHNMIIAKLREHAASASAAKSNNIWITLEVVLKTLPLDLILKSSNATKFVIARTYCHTSIRREFYARMLFARR